MSKKVASNGTFIQSKYYTDAVAEKYNLDDRELDALRSILLDPSKVRSHTVISGSIEDPDIRNNILTDVMNKANKFKSLSKGDIASEYLKLYNKLKSVWDKETTDQNSNHVLSDQEVISKYNLSKDEFDALTKAVTVTCKDPRDVDVECVSKWTEYSMCRDYILNTIQNTMKSAMACDAMKTVITNASLYDKLKNVWNHEKDYFSIAFTSLSTSKTSTEKCSFQTNKTLLFDKDIIADCKTLENIAYENKNLFKKESNFVNIINAFCMLQAIIDDPSHQMDIKYNKDKRRISVEYTR